MRKLILKWLFGTDNIERYMEVLNNGLDANQRCINAFNSHIQTLNEQKEDIDTMRKLIVVCKNHGINVDEEIKHIKL